MMHRPSPQPTADRARETEALMVRKVTDIARWSRFENLATQWDARAAMAAEWIPAGARVLDLGCGAMTLGSLLKDGCSYFPADVVERRPGAFVVDLNRGEFPPGSYDWITFLGVLEYVHEPVAALKRAHAAAPNLLATYCTHTAGDVEVRRGMGWVNDLTRATFEDTLQAAGWQIRQVAEVKRGPTNIQLMFDCGHAG